MNTLRYLQAATLLSFFLGSGIAAAAQSEAARATTVTSGEVKLPQVIIIGKRLSAAEKARMAQEDSNLENKKMLSKQAPHKTAKLAGNVG